MAKREGGGSVLVILGLLLGYIFFGPDLARTFAGSSSEVFKTLAPIVGPIVGVILAVLIVRYYWSRS